MFDKSPELSPTPTQKCDFIIEEKNLDLKTNISPKLPKTHGKLL